jgi:hypothetical protein
MRLASFTLIVLLSVRQVYRCADGHSRAVVAILFEATARPMRRGGAPGERNTMTMSDTTREPIPMTGAPSDEMLVSVT